MSPNRPGHPSTRWPLLVGAQTAFSVVLAAALFMSAAWVLSDVTLYYQWSGRVIDGQVPYRDFSFDYPPLALPALMVPRLLTGFQDINFGAYLVLFAASMAILSLVLAHVVGVIARSGWPRSSPVVRFRHVGLMALSLPVLLIRYDLWPIVLVALALLAAVEGRPIASGAWLGVGIAAKLYPIVLVPVFAALWWARRDRSGASRLMTAAVGMALLTSLPVVLLAGSAFGDLVEFQQGRGLQVETAAGGVIQLLNAFASEGVTIVHTGTYELQSARTDAYLGIQPAIAVIATGGAVVLAVLRLHRAARSGTELALLPALSTGVLFVFVLTNRALSPQHIFWCLSFAAFLGGRRVAVLAVIIGLTLAVFPLWYEGLLRQELAPILVLNARNALLLVFAAILLLGSADAQGAGKSPNPGASRSGSGMNGPGVSTPIGPIG